MDKVFNTARSGSATDTPLHLPETVPVIEADELEGATRRSARARRLHARLEARTEEGRPLAAREVDEVVRGCRRADGKPDGDQAVVVAAHARRSPRLFGGGHHGLLRFLARVGWGHLIRDLRSFITKVREQEMQERKREAIRKEIHEDRVEVDTRRADLLHHDKVRDAAPVPQANPALTQDNQLRFTLERMKRG